MFCAAGIGSVPHEKTWIKEIEVGSMAQMRALRRVDRTIVHLFPPQRQQLGHDLRFYFRQVFLLSIYETNTNFR
jgi:hypothetical protein